LCGEENKLKRQIDKDKEVIYLVMRVSTILCKINARVKMPDKGKDLKKCEAEYSMRQK
jgi:hypothetical protein